MVLGLFASNNVALSFAGCFTKSLLLQLQCTTQKRLAQSANPGGNAITVNIKFIRSCKDTAIYYLFQNAVTIYDLEAGEKQGRPLDTQKKSKCIKTSNSETGSF